LEQNISETENFNDTTTREVHLPRSRRLNLLALTSVIFFTVSGGAYGLEPLVGAVGAGWAVALVLVTPLLWSLPIALMVSELSSMMPEEGGYYVWVREGLGDFWGVQEGWWTICYTAVDMAIYPVLFIDYLGYFFPKISVDEAQAMSWSIWLTRWLIAVLLIAVACAINWRGARAVGTNAAFNVLVVLAPFVLLVLFGFLKSGAAHTAASVVVDDLKHRPDNKLLTLGLAIVLWNYCGWDNVSTFAAEVNDARKNYPRAMMAALPLTVAAYLLPLLAGIAVTTDANVWSEDAGWPVIGEMIGGSWLGIIITAAALVSAWSLFNSQLLYVSRLPYAMARDRWLPLLLARVSKRTAVPTVALLASCFVSALFATLSFGKLVILDIMLYAAALSLEFFALLALRRSRPEMSRPFRVPGGWPVLFLITIAPTCFAILVFIASFQDKSADPRQMLIVCVVILSGVVIYFTRRRKALKNK